MSKRGLSVTRTFRLEREWIEALDTEARNQGVSSSSLLNQIMKRYALSLRYWDMGKGLHIPKEALIVLLSNASENDITRVGSSLGISAKLNYLYMFKLPATVDGVVSFLHQYLGNMMDG